jgi:ABC-type polysaccharide/polyol phosphate export permease
MKCNVGSIDRLLRIIVGLIVAILGVYFENWWGLVGVVLIATGLFKFCPIYWTMKMSTAKKEE